MTNAQRNLHLFLEQQGRAPEDIDAADRAVASYAKYKGISIEQVSRELLANLHEDAFRGYRTTDEHDGEVAR